MNSQEVLDASQDKVMTRASSGDFSPKVVWEARVAACIGLGQPLHLQVECNILWSATRRRWPTSHVLLLL